MWRQLLTVALTGLLSAVALGAGLTSFNARNYEVFTDVGEARARPVAEHMDQVFDEYARRFKDFNVKNSQRVRLYLFGSRDAYYDYLNTKGVNARNTAGLFFASTQEAGLATYLNGHSPVQMFHVLQHEGFHQFAHLRIGSGLPQWANEGLAEYFGQAILVKGKLRLGVAPEERIESLKKEIAGNKAFAFDEILYLSNEAWNKIVHDQPRRAGVMYDQAWAMAHFLIHGAKGKYAEPFGNFIKYAANGLQPRQAFSKAFGSGDTAPFEKSWKSYMQDEIEPDAVSTAMQRLDFLSEGAKYLAGRDTKVDSLQALKTELRRIGFKMTVTSDSGVREYDAADDSLFEPPPGDDPKRPVTLEVVPPVGAKSPIGFRVKGLTIGIRLTWDRSGAGAGGAGGWVARYTFD